MEEVLSNNPPLLLLTLLILIPVVILWSTISIVNKKKKNKSSTFPLPPGPWKLPIIGNIHQLALSTNATLVQRCLAELAQQYGPVMHLQLGETSNVVLSSAKAARAFFKTHDHDFPIRSYMASAHAIFYDSKDIAMSSEGDYWRRVKKICTVELLSEKRVKSMRPIREEEVGKAMKFIGSCCDGGTVNLSRLLLEVGYTMTSRAAFGKNQDLEGPFLPVMSRILYAIGGFSIGDIFPSYRLLRLISGTERHLKKLHQEVDAILQGIIDEHVLRSRRRKDKEHDHDIAKSDNDEEEEDLVDVLLACTNNHVEVKAVILDIFLAGGDTSTITVEWVMSELMKNPEKMEKVQREVRQLFDKRGKVVDEGCFDELHYLKAVVKETLRLHPPIALSFPRESRETVVIDGYQIPPKTKVIVNYWAVCRDSSHWTQPDQFIPERFLNTSINYKGVDYQLLPFGAGRRICPGINYGEAILYLLLANFLYHFDWKLPNNIKPQDFDMSESSRVTIARENDLKLIPIPYHAP